MKTAGCGAVAADGAVDLLTGDPSRGDLVRNEAGALGWFVGRSRDAGTWVCWSRDAAEFARMVVAFDVLVGGGR
jgi:hypothetical protein